jgi:hypothetical protein
VYHGVNSWSHAVQDSLQHSEEKRIERTGSDNKLQACTMYVYCS